LLQVIGFAADAFHWPDAIKQFSMLALAIADFKSSLAPCGAPAEFKHRRRWLRGGMTGRSYEAKFADTTLRVWTYEMPDGKLEQYMVEVTE